MESEKITYIKDEKDRIIQETVKNLNDADKVIFHYEYDDNNKQYKTLVIEYFKNTKYITVYKRTKDNTYYGIKINTFHNVLMGGIEIFDEQNNFVSKHFLDGCQYRKNFIISGITTIDGKTFNIQISKTIGKIEGWINGLCASYTSDEL